MRDILITLVILGTIPFILRRPSVGVFVWAWLSMMIPYRAAYGFARTLPFSQIVALATILGLIFSRDRFRFPVNAATVTQIIFVSWMVVTSFFAINSAEIVADRLVLNLKIHLMLFLTLMLLRGRAQIELLIWIVTLSVGFYGIKGGVWTVATGGSGRVWGPSGGVLQGNNELGLALVMLIPFMYYLQQVSVKKWVRLAMVACIITCCFGILGTQSRGAVLALLAMSAFLILKGKYPIRMFVFLGALLAIAFVFMPESWMGRMGTIQTFDQDTSAMSRIYTWTTLWNVALDRPLVGAGFGADTMLVFAKYAPAFGVGIYTQGGVFVAHSIYFQALGEHGFPGLLAFLLLGVLTWKIAEKVAVQTKDDPEYSNWAPLLMRMIQVSLIGFSVGGAFLSLVYFDLPYYLIVFATLVHATFNERTDYSKDIGNKNSNSLQPSK